MSWSDAPEISDDEPWVDSPGLAEPAVKAEPSEDLRGSPSRSRSRGSPCGSSRSPSPALRARARGRRGKVTGAETVGPWPAWRDAVAALQEATAPETPVLVHKSSTQRRYKVHGKRTTVTVYCGTRNAHVQGGADATALQAKLQAALARARAGASWR